MRQRLFFVLLLLPSIAWAVCPTTDSYSTTVCADSPVHYLRMDATSGSLETDVGSQPFEASSNPQMTYSSGGVTLNQTGAFLVTRGITDPSVNFNGSTGYASRAKNNVVAPAACSPDTTNGVGWTNETWFNYTTATGNKTMFAALALPTNTTTDVYEFKFNNGLLRLFVGDGTAEQLVADTGAAPSINVWHHAVVTTVGSGSGHLSSIIIYIDGVSAVSTSYSASSLIACNSNSYISIGSKITATTPTAAFFFPGNLDEMAWYTSALSAARVLVHYQAGIAAPTGAWPFTVKRPELPKFRDPGYFAEAVARGYNTGHFTFREIQPQLLNVGYPNFAVMPWGSVGRR